MKVGIKAALNEEPTRDTQKEGSRKAIRKASSASLRPKRSATTSSFAVEPSLAMRESEAMRTTARKIFRLVVNGIRMPRRDSLFILGSILDTNPQNVQFPLRSRSEAENRCRESGPPRPHKSRGRHRVEGATRAVQLPSP